MCLKNWAPYSRPAWPARGRAGREGGSKKRSGGEEGPSGKSQDFTLGKGYGVGGRAESSLQVPQGWQDSVWVGSRPLWKRRRCVLAPRSQPARCRISR